MPMIERIARICTILWSIDALGSRFSENRRKPYVPIFSNTAARITETAVGASTCASGSQVWKGNMGTLMAKPMKNAQKTHCWVASGRLSFISSEISNVDRKSTRLNSSHLGISYAVFFLIKKETVRLQRRIERSIRVEKVHVSVRLCS